MAIRTREQVYAAGVFKRVAAIKADRSQEARSRYGGMAHKLPILIRTAGLAPALAFVASSDKAEHKRLLADLAAVLGWESSEKLLEASRLEPLDTYMRLTGEALAALLWFKRFAQSELDVEGPGDE